MGARGHVHVRMSAADAAATARWLRAVAVPKVAARADTVLTPGYNAELAKRLAELAALLDKKARRKRQGAEFAPLVPVELVAVMGTAVALNAQPAMVRRVQSAMHDAVAGPGRGRPRLSDADVAAHFAGKRKHPRASNPQRWPARLKRRERIAAKYAAWSDAVRARGETVLTTTVPLPKI
jgi:hypothetical protein